MRRQVDSTDSGFLDSTGQIQKFCQRGSVFRLVNGYLFSGHNQISVSHNVPSARFSTSNKVEALDQTFAVASDETLFWNNDAFTDGSARFGADTGGVVYAFFSGALSSDYNSVSLTVLDSKPINTTSSAYR